MIEESYITLLAMNRQARRRAIDHNPAPLQSILVPGRAHDVYLSSLRIACFDRYRAIDASHFHLGARGQFKALANLVTRFAAGLSGRRNIELQPVSAHARVRANNAGDSGDNHQRRQYQYAFHKVSPGVTKWIGIQVPA